MPDPYRIDPNSGELIWRWEEEEQYMEEEKMANTLASKNNKTIKIKCDFCKKNITNAVYTFSKGGGKFHTCSGCKFIYQTLYEEIKANRFLAIRIMLTMAIKDIKHCECCRWFDKNEIGHCKKGKYIGLGEDDSSSYPLSYANHGCPYFLKINYLYNVSKKLG